MAQQAILNGETGLVIRTKLNDNFTELYADPFLKTSIKAKDANGLSLVDKDGVLGLFVIDGGNVGIGVSSPANQLHIKSIFQIDNVTSPVKGIYLETRGGTDWTPDLYIQGTYTGSLSTRTRLIIKPPAGTTGQGARIELDNDSSLINFGTVAQGTRLEYGLFEITNTGTPAQKIERFGIGIDPLNIHATSNCSFDIVTDGWVGSTGTVIFRVRKDGNVGIGTLTPDSKLDIKTTDKQIRLTNNASDYMDLYIDNASKDAYFDLRGTTKDTGVFHLIGKEYAELSLSDPASTHSLSFGTYTDEGYMVTKPSIPLNLGRSGGNYHISCKVGETEINPNGLDLDFRIQSDTIPDAFFLDGGTGDVGIGTATPAAKLEIETTGEQLRLTGSVGVYSKIYLDYVESQKPLVFDNANTGSTVSRFDFIGEDGKNLNVYYRDESFNNYLDFGITSSQTWLQNAGNVPMDFYGEGSYHHLSLRSNELLINVSGRDIDFRIKSDTIDNAFFVDGATGKVGISTSVSKSVFEVNGSIGEKVTKIDNTDSPYTVLDSERFISVNITAGNVQINLPLATNGWNATDEIGRKLYISDEKCASSGTYDITVNRSGTDTITTTITGKTSVIFNSNGAVKGFQVISANEYKEI